MILDAWFMVRVALYTRKFAVLGKWRWLLSGSQVSCTHMVKSIVVM